MNIMGYIREKKEGFRQAQMKKAARDIEKLKREDEKLTEKRMLYEDRARLEKQIKAEKARIAEANPSKLQSFGKGLARVVNNKKGSPRTKTKGVTGARRGVLFHGINTGAKNIDFGGNTKSPFNK